MTRCWWNLSPDIEERLRKRFPELLHSLHLDCGDGWAWLIYRALEWIERELKELGEDYDSFHCSQIKEKFGELRIYMYGITDKISEICETAQEISKIICEECGRPGKIRPDKWVVTRCDNCYNRRKNES
jgi:hypothetical protein